MATIDVRVKVNMPDDVCTDNIEIIPCSIYTDENAELVLELAVVPSTVDAN